MNTSLYKGTVSFVSLNNNDDKLLYMLVSTNEDAIFSKLYMLVLDIVILKWTPKNVRELYSRYASQLLTWHKNAFCITDPLWESNVGFTSLQGSSMYYLLFDWTICWAVVLLLILDTRALVASLLCTKQGKTITSDGLF